MTIQINRFFPYLLILSVVAAAMEIDLSLPSFPDIARAFSVPEEMVERTISLNFLGFCLSALCYGPLADRFGRRLILLIGSSLFLLGSLGCAFSPTISFILFSRFIQGLGAAASFVIVFTMISDVYKGNEATKWIGSLNAILTTTMAAAPILGGLLNARFGWQGCYSFIAIFTAFVFILLVFFLPETQVGQKVSFKEVLKDYNLLVFSKSFLQSSLVPTLLAGGYMAFVAFVPFYYRDKLQMPLGSFSLHQSAIIASFSISSYFASRVSEYFGEKKAALRGLFITSLSAISLLVLSLYSATPSAGLITPLMCIVAVTCAVGFAVVFSASLSIFPDKNGPASSLVMSMRTFVCALTVQLSGFLYNGTLFPTALIVAISGMLAFVLAMNYYRNRDVIIESTLENEQDESIS